MTCFEDDACHLEIERVAWPSEWTEKQLAAATSLLSAMPEADRVHSSKAVRSFNFRSGRLEIAVTPGSSSGATEALVMSLGDYWPRFDEIVCKHLLIFEDDGRRDRDRELLSVRLK